MERTTWHSRQHCGSCCFLAWVPGTLADADLEGLPVPREMRS
jgi:hypothetical protein